MDDLEKIENEVNEDIKDVIPDMNPEGNNEANDGTVPGISFINPDEPITQETIDQVGKLIQQVGDNVRIMQSIWQDTQREFGLKEEELKELYAFNNNHLVPKPEDGEDNDDWDMYNGLDQLTDEDLERIFSHDHPIYGVDTSQTIDRIKSAFQEFINWMAALREYKNVNTGYAVLMDMYDDQNINELQKICDEETDPDKKRIQQAAIDVYRSNKNCGFMREPLDDASIKRIMRAFTNKETCDYWLKRSIDKLRQLKINNKFLTEIWGFEKRFLDEKYHRMNNGVLLYFLHTIVYCKCTDTSKDNVRRTHVIFMFSALDGYVQNMITPERKEKIKENICIMLDQLMEHIPEGAETINDADDSK